MPLHRHECEACGHEFRVLVLQGAVDEAPICPECGSTVTRRKLPLVSVHFKGSGYYKTDHGRRGSGRPDKGSAEAGSGDSDSAESSSGSKASEAQSESRGPKKPSKKPSPE